MNQPQGWLKRADDTMKVNESSINWRLKTIIPDEKGQKIVSSQKVGEDGVFWAFAARAKHPPPPFIEKLQKIASNLLGYHRIYRV